MAEAIGDRAHVRTQLPFLAGGASVPEPDVAVVGGHFRDYREAHPKSALLIVEIADTSILQDRLTKAAIYAAADVPEYWIVNLRDSLVEVHRDPEAMGTYRSVRAAERGERLHLVALPAAAMLVDELLTIP